MRSSLCALGLVVGLLSGPAAAEQTGPVVRPGRTARVSVSSTGSGVAGFSYAPVISGNGRYVAFVSDASNLVPGDTNGFDDVFVHDRHTGHTERASVSSSGEEANALAADPEISGDGRHVAFVSVASNLVPGDTNDEYDVFVRDLDAGTTERVSIGSEGQQAEASSNDATISADGRYVGFATSATNLVGGDTNSAGDAFIRDRVEGTTIRVSLGTGGVQADLGGGAPSISPDGTHVAFGSISTNLDGVDGTVGGDIFLRDLAADTTVRVSVPHNGLPANDQSVEASVSEGGRFVTFRSLASNLVPGDRNSLPDFFVRDVEAGTTERVSVSSAGANGGDLWYGAPSPTITPDGRYVAFSTVASLLVPGDDNANLDVFVHDRLTRSTEVATITAAGTQGYGTKASISADGRYVAFTSDAPLVPEDDNENNDIYVRDRGPDLGVGELTAMSKPNGVEVAGWATFSGARIASASDPAGDAPGDVLGTDLAGVELAYRPHTADILITWTPTEMAAAPAVHVPVVGPFVTGSYPAAPAVYTFSFRVGGTDWEVRGAAGGAPENAPAVPAFALYRCAETCEEVAALSGGLGDRGTAVTAAVPLDKVTGFSPGVALDAMSASTWSGTMPAPADMLDHVQLGSTVLPEHSVSLALVPEGEIPEEGEFHPAAETGEPGGFLSTMADPFGSPRLWARACLGAECSYLSRRVA